MRLKNTLTQCGNQARNRQRSQHKSGVKISAGPINKCGIEYYSWKDGVGYFATFWFDVEIDDYGIADQRSEGDVTG